MPQIVCPWCNQITNKIDNYFRFVCCGKTFHECPDHNKASLVNGKKYIIGGPGPNECRYCKAHNEKGPKVNIPIPVKEVKIESSDEDDKKIPKHMIELCSKRPNLKKLIIGRHGK